MNHMASFYKIQSQHTIVPGIVYHSKERHSEVCHLKQIIPGIIYNAKEVGLHYTVLFVFALGINTVASYMSNFLMYHQIYFYV